MKRTLVLIALVASTTIIYCQKVKSKKERNRYSHSRIKPESNPAITPKEYQGILGKGIDVTWAETPKGIESFNSQMVKDFKKIGFSHVRVRVKDNLDEKLLAHIDKIANECLTANLIPIIAYHGGEFEEQPTRYNLNKSVEWWKTFAEHSKSYSHRLAFDLIIEVSDALNKEKELLNQFYEEAVSEIRKSNPDRIIFISPVLRSSPENLKYLKIPSKHNNFLMAEWHFYASGPDRTNENKKWTTGTMEEKELIRAKIKHALDWQHKTGMYTWVGAWMAGNYNKGNTYTPEEQIVFANFVTCELTKNKIPFAINADHKFYNALTNTWYKELKPVVDEVIKTTCE